MTSAMTPPAKKSANRERAPAATMRAEPDIDPPTGAPWNRPDRMFACALPDEVAGGIRRSAVDVAERARHRCSLHEADECEREGGHEQGDDLVEIGQHRPRQIRMARR